MKNKIYMFIAFTFVMMLAFTYRVDAKVTDKGYTLYINGVKATENVILEGYTVMYTVKDSKGNHVNTWYSGENKANMPSYKHFGTYHLYGKISGRTENLSFITESGKKLNFSFKMTLGIDYSTIEVYNKDTNTNIPEILLRKSDHNNDIILSQNIMYNIGTEYDDFGVYKMSNNDDWEFNLEFKLYEDSKCTKEVSNVSDYVWAKKKKNGYWYFTEREGIYSKGTPCRFFIRFRMYDSVVGKNSTPFIIANDDVEYYEELLRIMEKIKKS